MERKEKDALKSYDVAGDWFWKKVVEVVKVELLGGCRVSKKRNSMILLKRYCIWNWLISKQS